MSDYRDREISMPVDFEWSAREEFNRNYRGEWSDCRFILNFTQTKKIDAVGVGMILQLVDMVAGDRRRLHLVRAVGQVREVLKAAGLDAVASFEYPAGLAKV